MTPERWRRIKELCDVVLECEPRRRRERLAELCIDDPELQHEVETMLARATAGEGILDAPVWDKLGLAATQTAHMGGGPSVPCRPETLGRYRILRLLGEGGMGAVYEAEQDQPHRTVALKVVKPGFATAELLRRFERESQALGRLQHPGIAQIYEAGTADTGYGPQPYFAMELIRGETLNEYADGRQLSPRHRLELVARICDAVEHAHERGLIHRDLKPGNILVDQMGQPKILDFGVARLTDSGAQATRQTDLGQLVGTLAYMSPEQVLADPLELDTRSDVYSLGVILYELLAGRLPYTISNKLHEVVQTIREADPARLSSISRNYRGDIEAIVAKALEKDKGRRYASAAALAEDIRRYLADQPIAARPASTTYQLQKFARRHKALVGGAAAVFVVLVAGIVVSTWEAVRARRAERTAVEAQQTAQAVNDFLQNDLLAQASADKQANPNQKPDPDLKVRTALDRAAARIGGKFGKQPLVEAAIRDTIGQTYMELGLYPEARTQLEHALELHRHELGPENPMTLATARGVGLVANLQGRYAEAEAALRDTTEFQRRVLGPENPDTLKSMNNLALVYYEQGKYAEVEAVYSQLLEIRRRVIGTEHPDTLKTMGNLARVYQSEGKYVQAEVLDSQTLEMMRRVLGSEHPDTLMSMNNLAVVEVILDKYRAAEELDRRAFEVRQRVLGPEHPDTLQSLHNLAVANYMLGRYAQAAALFTQATEIRRRVLGPEHPRTLVSMSGLADAYAAQGEYARAEADFRRILEISRRVRGLDHPDTLHTLSEFASMYQQWGKYAPAETYAAQALAGRRRALGSENEDTMGPAADLALAYLSQGKFTGSEPLAREAFEFFRKKQPDDWQRFRAESLLGASLAGQKKYAEAEPVLLEGYQGMLARKERIALPDQYHLRRAHEWLVQLYQAWGKPEKVAEWREKPAATSQ